MKKSVSMLLAALMLTGALAGCGSSASGTQAEDGADSGVSGAITVISREDGSGTRGAFIELTGVEEKTADGKKVDNTTADAEIANKTDVVLTSVAGNEKAIGYISLGALNDTVKAVKVDGAEATVDNVKAGAYKLSRPFNIATKGEPTGVAKDFISFILSKEGQAVVTDNKYIAVNDAAESFVSDGSSGQIAVGGSSSVSPVMEKLIEAYKSVNPNASIDLQTSDSTSGMTGAMDGTFAIGMASRELKRGSSPADRHRDRARRHRSHRQPGQHHRRAVHGPDQEHLRRRHHRLGRPRLIQPNRETRGRNTSSPSLCME